MVLRTLVSFKDPLPPMPLPRGALLRSGSAVPSSVPAGLGQVGEVQDPHPDRRQRLRSLAPSGERGVSVCVRERVDVCMDVTRDV